MKEIEDFFQKWPESKRLFYLISDYINSLGQVRMEVLKTQISFGTKKNFAWVWLPQIWIKKRPADSITLTFDLDHKIENSKIDEVVEVRKGKWTHHIVIKNSEDFNKEIKNWVKEAYKHSF